jgi:hypothetical protein
VTARAAIVADSLIGLACTTATGESTAAESSVGVVRRRCYDRLSIESD